MNNSLPVFLSSPNTVKHGKIGRTNGAFLFDKILNAVAALTSDSALEWRSACQPGFLQKTPAVSKILFSVTLLILVSVANTLTHQAVITLLVYSLAWMSRLALGIIIKRALTAALIFGVLIPLPLLVSRGIGSGALLFWRVFNSITISLVLLLATSFPKLLQGLKGFKVPSAFILILSLTRQWVFEFSKTIQDMALARKSRTIALKPGKTLRIWLADRLGELFVRTQQRSDEVWRAIQSRSVKEPFVFSSRFPTRDFFVWRSLVLLVLAGLLMVF